MQLPITLPRIDEHGALNSAERRRLRNGSGQQNRYSRESKSGLHHQHLFPQS